MNPPQKKPALNGPLVTLRECGSRHRMLRWVITGLVVIGLAYAGSASLVLNNTMGKVNQVRVDTVEQVSKVRSDTMEQVNAVRVGMTGHIQSQVEVTKRLDGTLTRMEGVLEEIRRNGGGG